ncbi:hypothetical protein B857_02345 [Solibacillus isronensis B3W22]|uniref:Uncharacterized protein n=1 Tax=Solibacillus isronensis B3W22 TaxID=1224748 RepID=K1L263_9BACL|nr:hypothetical protein B857_02345 [Solibacillus isronensis B3W22]
METPVNVDIEELPSTVETPEQVTEEGDNTVSEPVQEPVPTETEEISVDPEKEQNQADKIALKDKVVGYYQDLVASFSNFLSFLK